MALGAKLVVTGVRTKKRVVHAVVLAGVLGPGLVGIGRVHAHASAPREQIEEGRPQIARFLREECGVDRILALMAEDRHKDAHFMALDFVRAPEPKKQSEELRDQIGLFCRAFGFTNVLGRKRGRPPILVTRDAVPHISPFGVGDLKLKSVRAKSSVESITPVGNLKFEGEAELERISDAQQGR